MPVNMNEYYFSDLDQQEQNKTFLSQSEGVDISSDQFTKELPSLHIYAFSVYMKEPV